MFGFLKKRMIVAEVDGIKFYSERVLKNYLREKQIKESRKGKHLYTFDVPVIQVETVSGAEVALEEAGCFDYRVIEGSLFYRIQYWSDRILLGWKTKDAKEVEIRLPPK